MAVTGRAGYTVDKEDEKVVSELVLVVFKVVMLMVGVFMVLMLFMVVMVENGGDGNRGGGSVKQLYVLIICYFATGNGWNDVHRRG